MDAADAQKLAQPLRWAERVCLAALGFGCCSSCLRAAHGSCARAVGGGLGGEPETKGRGGHGHLATLLLVCKWEAAPRSKCRSLRLSQTNLKVLRD